MTTALITTPGVYEMTAAEYHADPVEGGSLSSTGARRLLPPSCPAAFDWARRNPQKPKAAFDLGTAAHKLVLGEGGDLAIIDADDWTTKAARTDRDLARLQGATPLLRPQYERVQAMALALIAHPLAGPLFATGRGTPEAALVHRDAATGVWRRALLDWLPAPRSSRVIIPDYKTAVSAAPDAIARAVAEYGYHQQGAWYLDAARALDVAGDDAEFVLVVQEKDPPHLVTVVQLDAVALRIGRARNRRALEIYAECAAARRWPGYADDPVYLSLPPWAEKRDTEEYL
jgi:hypothetical protein